MPRAADLGGKRLVGLAPDAWARWVTGLPDVAAGEILSPDFQWIARETDVLLRVHHPDCGEFLLLSELQLRYDDRLPVRILAYSALAEERYGLRVYPVLVNILPTSAAARIPDRYESELLGLHVRRDFRVVNLWEVDAGLALDRPLPVLLPFVPVLRGGSDEGLLRRALDTLRADERLDELEPLFAFFATFVLETRLVRQIMRWDMAVLRESPWYNEILEQGLKEGREQGIQQGIQQGIRQGILEKAWEDILDTLQIRFGPPPLEVVARVRREHDPLRLRDLHRIAVACASFDEFLRSLGT